MKPSVTAWWNKKDGMETWHTCDLLTWTSHPKRLLKPSELQFQAVHRKGTKLPIILPRCLGYIPSLLPGASHLQETHPHIEITAHRATQSTGTKKSIITILTVCGEPTQISKISYDSSIFCGMASLTMIPTRYPGTLVKQEQFRGKIETTVPG